MTGAAVHGGRRRQVPARSRLGQGVVALLLAVLAAGIAGLVASAGHHAYDPNAVPRSSYHLRANKTYQLSSRAGPGGTAGTADPQCSYVQTDVPGAVPRALQLQSRRDDARDLHVLATFSVGLTGNFSVRCASLAQVFIDDADNSGTGYSTLLVVLAVVFGTYGVACTVSGLAGDFPAPPSGAAGRPGLQGGPAADAPGRPTEDAPGRPTADAPNRAAADAPNRAE